MERYNIGAGSDSAPAVPDPADNPFYQEGNPSLGVPATVPGPWWFHMITEEMRNVITDADLTPDHTDLTQLSAAIQAMIAANVTNVHGQCTLSKSGANLILLPKNGNKLIINGVPQTIPSAGVTLAPPATTLTLYYIYAYMNAGVMTLEASATGHSTDASTGVEIKTSDATRTLVGMARTVTNAWVDTITQRFVISYFNRAGKDLKNNFSTTRSGASGSIVEMNSEIRCEFLTWGNEIVDASITGCAVMSNTTPAATVLGFDGVADYIPTDATSNTSWYIPLCLSYPKILSEGYHYSTLGYVVSGGGGTINYYFPAAGVQAIYNTVSIRG